MNQPKRRISVKAGQHLATYVLSLPTAKDELGRWLDEHGGAITLTCQLGKWHCGVAWKRLLSYSDERGQHSEHKDVARYHEKPEVAFERAVKAAMAIEAGETLPEEKD